MSNDPAAHHARRTAGLFPPPIGQTPVDVRPPNRLDPDWLQAELDHLEAGREWLAQERAEELANYMWGPEDIRAMDDERDDRT